MVKYAKISPKTANPRDLAGYAEEEEEDVAHSKNNDNNNTKNDNNNREGETNPELPYRDLLSDENEDGETADMYMTGLPEQHQQQTER